MPKMKTNRAAAKRFKMTASGKAKRAKANKNHILTKKSKNRKRHLRGTEVVHETNQKEIRALMPYA